MSFFNRRSIVPPTQHGRSVEPHSRSDRTNPSRFRLLPSYPASRKQTLIKSGTVATTCKTSTVMLDDDSDSLISSDSSSTDSSVEYVKQKLLSEMTMYTNGTTDSIDDDVSDVTYSSDDEPRTSRPWVKPCFKFTCEGTGSVTSIAPLPHGDQAWVCKGNDKLLCLYHRNGHKKMSRLLSTKTQDLSVRHDGNVCLVQYNSPKVKLMSSSGKVTDICTLDLPAAGICATSRNESLATTCNVKTQIKRPRPRNKPSVVRLAHTGEKIWEIKRKGADEFVNPSKVAVNRHGDICVIDLEPSKEHIVIVTPDGELKGKYYGIKDSTLLKPFDPKDICYDHHGYVYVADLCNSAVHVLDRNGAFQRFFVTARDGILYPSSLAVDTGGYLWVGMASGVIRVYSTAQEAGAAVKQQKAISRR